MLPQGRYQCEKCGAVFQACEIKVNARDDYPCPACGSLRLNRIRERHEGTRGFLDEYSQL